MTPTKATLPNLTAEERLELAYHGACELSGLLCQMRKLCGGASSDDLEAQRPALRALVERARTVTDTIIEAGQPDLDEDHDAAALAGVLHYAEDFMDRHERARQ